MKPTIRALSACLVFYPIGALAGHTHQPIAPIGVMGDHTHEQGDWMFSYRYSTMHMNGSRDGDNRVSDAEVLADFMVTPTQMDMQMHMFSAMYGLNDRLSVMAMGSYVYKSMDHVTRMGVAFNTETEGFGDTQVGATYALYQPGHHPHEPSDAVQHQLFLNAALSLPTGSIDERDNTPAMANAVLPYPMQLGSGTVDPVLGLTYVGQQGLFAWGAQGKVTLRLYDNSEDYHLGNHYQTNLWGSVGLDRDWRITARLEGNANDNIDGADSRLNPMMVYTADPDRRAAYRLDALLGLSYSPVNLPDNRFAFEIGRPVYESLDGPQLETDWRLLLGWQWVF